jgi:hypothetical protein
VIAEVEILKRHTEILKEILKLLETMAENQMTFLEQLMEEAKRR